VPLAAAVYPLLLYIFQYLAETFVISFAGQISTNCLNAFNHAGNCLTPGLQYSAELMQWTSNAHGNAKAKQRSFLGELLVQLPLSRCADCQLFYASCPERLHMCRQLRPQPDDDTAVW